MDGPSAGPDIENRAGGEPMNVPRILLAVVGVVCLALGVGLGWIAAVQTSRGNGDVAAVLDEARADKAAASRAAVQAEGWARVANAASALAKIQNDQAQAAQKRAHDDAARAEKAAGRASTIAAHTEHRKPAPTPSPAAVVARATPAPLRSAPTPHPRRPVAKATTAARASDESCRRAAIFERTAANTALSRQAAYNASISGLAVNAHCSEPERSLIGAYLLAQRAAAESALSTGDWKSDLAQSNRVLSQCVRHPERYGALGRGCRQRLTKNVAIRRAATPRTPKPAQQASTEDHLLATPHP